MNHMKAYLAIKFYEDCANRVLIESISSTLDKVGIISIVMTRDFERWGAKNFSAEELMKLTFEQIDQSDIVIIEFSEMVGIGKYTIRRYDNPIRGRDN